MALFKTKEQRRQEKQAKLQQRVDELRTKNISAKDSYCKIDSFIFILKGFSVGNKCVIIHFIGPDTLKDHVSSVDIDLFHMRFGHTNFKKARVNFIRFRDELERIGLKLSKIETNG